MTKLLLRLFVKDYENTESVAVHSAIGKLAGVAGIVCNLLLFHYTMFVVLTILYSLILDKNNYLTSHLHNCYHIVQLYLLLPMEFLLHPLQLSYEYFHLRSSP